MRHYTFLLALFCLLHVGSLAQRPWTKSAWPEVGTTPHIAIVANTLIAYDTTAANSNDHSATWSPISTIQGPVRGTVDFPSVNSAIAVTQTAAGQLVHGFLTQSGSSWTHFDSIDIAGRLVTGVATQGLKIFVATNSSTIIVRGETNSEVTVPGGNEVVDIAATPEAIAVITSAGMQISTDAGQSWNEAHPDGGVPPSTMPTELTTVNGSIYASSDYGVLKLQVSNATLQPVSQWPVELGVPVVHAVAGDAQYLAALVTKNNQTQMYRLSTSDTAWTESAYPLPGTGPTYSKRMLVVENGWAVVNHQLVAGSPDSVGVYRFDLNDFTDVSEQHQQSGIKISSTQNGLSIADPPTTPFRIRIYDVTMRLLWENSFEGGEQNISLPYSISGFLCVTVTDQSGGVSCSTVLR